jgi:hypothetical protein
LRDEEGAKVERKGKEQEDRWAHAADADLSPAIRPRPSQVIVTPEGVSGGRGINKGEAGAAGPAGGADEIRRSSFGGGGSSDGAKKGSKKPLQLSSGDVDEAVAQEPIEIGDLGGHLGTLGTDLSVGKTVRISGLQSAEFNGKQGVIVEATGGRWAVQLSPAKGAPAKSPTRRLSLKPENLAVDRQ